MTHAFLIHQAEDDVGVAVRDIDAGEEVTGVQMDTGQDVTVRTTTPVLLGHKLALRGLQKGQEVIKYGLRIGLATKPIEPGDHVHTHNVRSARW